MKEQLEKVKIGKKKENPTNLMFKQKSIRIIEKANSAKIINFINSLSGEDYLLFIKTLSKSQWANILKKMPQPILFKLMKLGDQQIKDSYKETNFKGLGIEDKQIISEKITEYTSNETALSWFLKNMRKNTQFITVIQSLYNTTLTPNKSKQYDLNKQIYHTLLKNITLEDIAKVDKLFPNTPRLQGEYFKNLFINFTTIKKITNSPLVVGYFYGLKSESNIIITKEQVIDFIASQDHESIERLHNVLYSSKNTVQDYENFTNLPLFNIVNNSPFDNIETNKNHVSKTPKKVETVNPALTPLKFIDLEKLMEKYPSRKNNPTPIPLSESEINELLSTFKRKTNKKQIV
jgi:hypothetical protein